MLVDDLFCLDNNGNVLVNTILEKLLTFEGKLGNDCFSGDWPVRVDNIDDGYVRSLSDCETHYALVVSQMI
jgi:hypothetical protein